jgi:hypothetical protein
MKGSMKAKYTYHASAKPCQAKTNAVDTISTLSVDTTCTQNVVKLVIEDVCKLIVVIRLKESKKIIDNTILQAKILPCMTKG